MPHPHARLLETAIAAVRKACALCETARARLVTADAAEKADRSPVTIADLACQFAVARELDAAAPGIPMVGEEDASALEEGEPLTVRLQDLLESTGRPSGLDTLRAVLARGGHAGGASGTFWTLDPIDGTKGFLRAGQYAIALALIVDGRVELGVLGCPCLPPAGSPSGGSMFYARRGAGSHEISLPGGDARPVRVRRGGDPAEARVCESVESGHTSHGAAAEIARRLGIRAASLRMDSQAKYAAVARGDADIYLRLPTRADYREKIWDHAAGVVLVEEAGGTVTDTAGRPLDFSRGRELTSNRGVVVTSGGIHARVLEAVRAVLHPAS